MNSKASTPPEQNPAKPKSPFRLELARYNHRVVITDSIDKGSRSKESFAQAGYAVLGIEREVPHPVWVVWLAISSAPIPTPPNVVLASR